QVPRLVSAGLAATAYRNDERYAATEERRRMLFFELDGPPEDPQDRYFARVLAYGPAPLLLPPGTALPEPPEPPLPADPARIRAVTPGQSNDRAGLQAMQELIPAEPGKPGRHYLLPLPPSLDHDASELFGFFVYELRVGHDGSRWSTAQGRFGHPLRVTGVQHPPPPLRCAVTRDPARVWVSAPYANPIWQGRNLRPFPPRTTLQALLYAQVLQADGKHWRNVLLLHAPAQPRYRRRETPDDPRFVFGVAGFAQDEIARALAYLGLPLDASLSVVTVELLPEP